MGLLSFLSAGTLNVPGFKYGLDYFIDVLASSIGNAGFAVIIFTLLIKLVLSPLDFFSKKKMRINSLKMDRMRPQLEKLQKQYAGRKDLLNQKTMQLYKKEGYSMIGACLPQLITLGLFFYIFAAFRNFADRSNVLFFLELQKVYDPANPEAVKQAFSNNVQSFLWVQNVWRPDTWVSVMPTAEQFIGGGLGMNGVGSVITIEEYNDIISQIEFGPRGNSWNGLMLLPIIAVGVSFLSSWLMKKQNREMQSAMPQGAAGGAGMQKMMTYVMPIMMGIFAFMYTTAFTIYMVSNSIFTMGINQLLTLIVNKRYKELKPKKDEQPKASYMR